MILNNESLCFVAMIKNDYVLLVKVIIPTNYTYGDKLSRLKILDIIKPYKNSIGSSRLLQMPYKLVKDLLKTLVLVSRIVSLSQGAVKAFLSQIK